jgi:hypothetical protein
MPLPPGRVGQSRGFLAAGNIDRCIAVREMHVTFNMSYLYDHLTKIFRA